MTVSTSARPGPAALRRGPAALSLAALVCLVLLALALFASVMFGSKQTPAADVLRVVTGGGDEYLRTVVESRYPRTVLGVLAGLCLAVAGTLMQGITRNPLAEPGILGINAGASAGVVSATAFLGVSGQRDTVWWALAGALVTGVAVYAIGTAGGGSSPVRLVLAGAVLSAVLGAYIQGVALSRPRVFDTYRYWVVGALGGRGFDAAWSVLPFAVAGLLLALVLAPGLNAMAMGDDKAASLGVSPVRIKGAGLLAATLLSAAATAAVGPIAFVGLAVPHLVRMVVGADFRLQIAFSTLVGPSLLLLADVVGRVLLRPEELMVGVVTAFVGAPALLLAVRRMRGPA
ncbi:iron ABC transporter permease [Streptomyces sp. DpondAA-E10]|uniref:FecCD family ABC transporter permease n=2 Tax=Streptomyces TaxID=1883 RepID=UPI0001C1BB0A|nr:transport system permease protein [Streptomyces sp. SirexAA-E]MYT62634.1 iron chelate uptake ABC transporter family permease subunit [Streptomyces sp. SID8357]MYU31999.1 iron chelate uptake ABC transporter family permease subunit [Streptomyces sp. SID8358]MYW36460.1 iron chelate uptake ABC transporter family permease subunit [Streptomyces sp. SID1]MYX72773.1 iron chelate uptake ABC transporter family permease subunit [Streptomyces sp. SID3915]RAJ26936.1 iron complex transport system permeas